MEDKHKDHQGAQEQVGCFLGRLGHWRGWKVRVLGKIRRFWGDSKHADMRVAVIHEIMGAILTFLGF